MQAFFIDKKVDDGYLNTDGQNIGASSGQYRAYSRATDGQCAETSTGVYNTNVNDTSCISGMALTPISADTIASSSAGNGNGGDNAPAYTSINLAAFNSIFTTSNFQDCYNNLAVACFTAQFDFNGQKVYTGAFNRKDANGNFFQGGAFLVTFNFSPFGNIVHTVYDFDLDANNNISNIKEYSNLTQMYNPDTRRYYYQDANGNILSKNYLN